MEQQDRPRDQNDQQSGLADVDSINNLDTARMSLRWALERLSAIEKLRVEAADKAGREERAKTALERECQALRRAMAANAEDSSQRETYYKKLEGLMDLKLAGKLDVEALVKHESEVARMHEYLLQRQRDLETDYAVKRDELEKSYQSFRAEAEKERREAALKVEEALGQRRQTLDKEFAPKIVAIHETEARLRAQEKILADRQAHFEAFYSEQRSQLDREIKVFRQEVEEQVKFRLEGHESLIADRQAFREAAWERQKSILTAELAKWRTQHQDMSDKTVDLENRLSEAREHAKQADISVANEAMLREETTRLRRSHHEETEKNIVLEKRLVETQEALKRAELSAGREADERRRLEAAKQEEAEVLLRRCHEAMDRIVDLEKRLAQADERAEAAQMSMELKADEARRSELMRRDETGMLSQKCQEQTHRIVNLEKSLSQAEERAERAQMAMELKAEEAQRIDALERDEAARFQKKAQDLTDRVMTLERSLDEALSRADEAERLLAARNAALQRAEEARQRDSAAFALRAQDAAGRIVEMENLLAGTEEKVKRADLASAHQATLLREIGFLREKYREHMERNVELEHLLESADEAAKRGQAAAAAEADLRAKADEARKAEAQAWTQRFQSQLDKIVELEKQAAHAEDKASRSQMMMELKTEEVVRLEALERDETSALLQKCQENGVRIAEFEKALFEARQTAALDDSLRAELEFLRGKFQEQIDRNIGLERRITESQERAKRADLADVTEKTLRDEASALRAIHQKDGERIISLERELTGAQDAARRGEEAAARTAERLTTLETAKNTELGALLQRHKELTERTAALEKSLMEASEHAKLSDVRASYESTLAKEVAALRRDLADAMGKNLDLERRLSQAEEKAAHADIALRQAATSAQERSSAAEEASLWRQRAQEREKTALDLEKKLIEVSDGSQKRYQEALEKGQELEKRLVDTQDQARRAQLSAGSEAGLRQEAEAFQEKCRDQSQRILELERELMEALERAKRAELAGTSEALEKRLFLAEEAARQAERMTQDRGVVLSEKQSHWEEERKELLENLRRAESTMRDESRQARERLDEETALCRELEKKLALAQDAERRSRADAETARLILEERQPREGEEAASLPEEDRSPDPDSQARMQAKVRKLEERWDKERIALMGEANAWKLKNLDLLAMVSEFERRLSEAETSARDSGGTPDGKGK